MELAGKIALVTGAGVRLGRAIALGLAKNGCDVIVHYNKSNKPAQETARQIEKLGRRAKWLGADLSNEKQSLKLAKDAEKTFGRVDILVNSAAIFWPTPLEKLNAAELNTFLDINLKSPYILSAEIGKRMKKRGGGVIVNLACTSGLKPWKQFLPYSISKAGVIALTVGSAKLFGPEVRVNAVAPGTVLPPEDMPAAQVRKIAAYLPLRQIGTPQDVVSAVLYLVQADFVTGQVLCVDGGRSIV